MLCVFEWIYIIQFCVANSIHILNHHSFYRFIVLYFIQSKTDWKPGKYWSNIKFLFCKVLTKKNVVIVYINHCKLQHLRWTPISIYAHRRNHSFKPPLKNWGRLRIMDVMKNWWDHILTNYFILEKFQNYFMLEKFQIRCILNMQYIY